MFFIGQDSGGKIIQQSLGTAQPQEKVIGSSSVQQSIQVENTFIYVSLSLKILVKSGMFQLCIDNLGVLAGLVCGFFFLFVCFRVYEVTQACQILP